MEGGKGEGLPSPQRTLSRRKVLAGAGGVAASVAAGFALGRLTNDSSPKKPAPPKTTPTETPSSPASPTAEDRRPIQTSEPVKPTQTPETPTPTMTATEKPFPTKTNTASPTTEPAVEPTDEPDEIIEEELSPTATPTEKPKKRSLKEILADADMDKEKMRELYHNNTKIITNPWDALSDPRLSGEWLPDGFGNGWCLAGVRYSLQLTDIAIEGLKGIGSAYKAEAVLDDHPELFEKLNISRKSIPSLPPGSILVYEPNQDSDPGGGSYDQVPGNPEHHGHISIIRGRNDQREVLVGSDHQELLAKDMSLMHHKINAYVIKKPTSAS